MAFALHRMKKPKSSGKKNPGTRGCIHCLFQSKSIIVILIGCSFVYFLSFLNVVVRVHQLDDTGNNLINDVETKDRAKIIFQNTNKDSNDIDRIEGGNAKDNAKEANDEETTDTSPPFNIEAERVKKFWQRAKLRQNLITTCTNNTQRGVDQTTNPVPMGIWFRPML